MKTGDCKIYNLLILTTYIPIIFPITSAKCKNEVITLMNFQGINIYVFHYNSIVKN